MDSDLKKAKELLLNGNYTYVLVKGDKQHTSSMRGIKPMLSMYQSHREQMKGATVADRVIGDAAARIAVKGGIKAIYTPIISETALKTCKQAKMEVFFDKKVAAIINRKKDGFCPMEKISQESLAFDEMLEKIENFLDKMSKS